MELTGKRGRYSGLLQSAMPLVFLAFSCALGTARAAVAEWDYTVSAAFVTTPGATTFRIGSGCQQVTSNYISWGTGGVGSCVSQLPPPIPGRSGFGISNTPRTGALVTNGATQVANTYTHYNNPVSSAHATLNTATISATVGLKAKGSADPYAFTTLTYVLKFFETPNTAPCVAASPEGNPCSDVWVLDGPVSEPINIDGNEYIVNLLPGASRDPLPPEVCLAAGALETCHGFITDEGMANAIDFLLEVKYPTTTVAGRIYAEGSTPANTQDNGNTTDPGSQLAVSLSCTEPSYSAGPTTTNADGSFSFAGVPVSASCTVSATPPSGYQAAYTQQGTTGANGDPGTLNTGVAGSTALQTITVVVPPAGSTGNLFALRPLTDMLSATVCTPNTASAGATVSCTTTCTNTGSGTAFNAFCSIPNAAALPGSPVPSCTSPANVAGGAALSCTVSFTMPDGGNITVVGGTGADNDSNGGSDPSSGNNPSNSSVTRQVATAVPVPGLGSFALVLLGMMVLLAFTQHQRQSGRGVK